MKIDTEARYAKSHEWVRLADDAAFLTVKSRTEGISRAEYEYGIPFADGVAMLETLDRAFSLRNAVTNRFGEALKYHAADLQAAGIIG